MLHFKKFSVNPIEENCYVLHDDTKECAIIDCGALRPSEKEEIARYIEEEGLNPVMDLQTHMHFDHVFGLPFIKEKYGFGPRCMAEDLAIYEASAEMADMMFRGRLSLQMVPVDEFLTDNQEITFGETTLKVLHTPGHTPGGACFYCESEGILFSGDTLFCGSVGRTDFPGGSMKQEIESVTSRILTLPDETKIYPGHGPETTVAQEKRNNTYLF